MKEVEDIQRQLSKKLAFIENKEWEIEHQRKLDEMPKPASGKRMSDRVKRLNRAGAINTNHPFAKLAPIKSLQIAFEKCAQKDLEWTQDYCHLMSNKVVEAYTKETLGYVF